MHCHRKSQIAIEYCYRFKESHPDAHVLWVYGGTIARFYEGYKRIAQILELPGWDDPSVVKLDLVKSWLSTTTTCYLLVIDNADNIEHWWPGKYKSGASLDDPSKNLSKFLPDHLKNGHILITTRDDRVADRLAKGERPITLRPMSNEEAKSLFWSKVGRENDHFDETEISNLLKELDHLPLAVSQAAAFLKRKTVSLAGYINALQGKAAAEFLHEELNDSRRDEESQNSVFRTWNLSFDLIKKQKPRAADVLALFAMFDRQSVPVFLLKLPEVATSLDVLQSFSLVTARAGSETFQIHRLVQRFVQLSLQNENTTEKWQNLALACVSRDYPTEIGVAEGPLCDALAPHVHLITRYEYKTTEARLDLAHLLCWAADFDIERGMYSQALERAGQSLRIFQELIPAEPGNDERLAAATWLYGRLRYYEAQTANDLDVAAELLHKALSISENPSLNYAESAFELAHLYYDQCNEKMCLEMGEASFKCWDELEGSDSVRTLDNMHDFALELALLGHEDDGIAKWHEIIERSPSSNASENTKTIYTHRSLAGIAEFEGNAVTAELYYARLITLCDTIYHSGHVHVFDYRLSHAEQIMRQGRLKEATQLSEGILADCDNTYEWRISASCFQTIAECCRLEANYGVEQTHRLRILELHEKKLGHGHKETIDAKEALADCLLNDSKHMEAQNLYQEVLHWRNDALGPTHFDTVRAIECIGICHSHQGQDAEAETAYLEAVNRKEDAGARLIDNLCKSLWNQGKWASLEMWSRGACEIDSVYRSSAQLSLISSLRHQGKTEEIEEMRVHFSGMEWLDDHPAGARRLPTNPPVRDDRRFGRMIHPRTWSA